MDLGQNATVSRAVIQEGWDRTRRFSVQYKAGDEWKDAAAGTTIGIKRQLEFTPVTARVFRLNITDATDVPTIWEFQLFPPPPAAPSVRSPKGRQSRPPARVVAAKSHFLSVSSPKLHSPK